MIIKKKVKYDPETMTGKERYSELRSWLVTAAERMDKDIPEGLTREVPDEPILIRADMTTPFKYVQDIMEQCGDKSIQIWKLQIAVSTPEGAGDE